MRTVVSIAIAWGLLACAHAARAQVDARLIAWAGGPTPLGGDYRYTWINQASIDEAGRVTFAAEAMSPTLGIVSMAVRGRPDDLRVMWRTGDLAPWFVDARFEGTTTTLPYTSGESVAMWADLVIRRPPRDGTRAVMMMEGDRVLPPVLWSGRDLTDVPGEVILGSWSARSFGGGLMSALIASLDGSLGTGSGVVLGSPAGIRIAAREGDQLPDFPDEEVVTGFSERLVVNRIGECLYGTYSRSAGSVFRLSLWRASVETSGSLVLAVGDAILDQGAWRVTSFGDPSINSRGDIALVVQGRRDGGPTEGAVIVGGPGRWQVAARTGGPVPGRLGLPDSIGTWGVIAPNVTPRPPTVHLLDDGRIVFYSSGSASMNFGLGIWMGPPDDLRLVVLDRDPVVGMPGGSIRFTGNMPMYVNPNGVVFFRAGIMRPGFSSTRSEFAFTPGVGITLRWASPWPVRDSEGRVRSDFPSVWINDETGSTGRDGRLSKLSNAGEYVLNLLSPTSIPAAVLFGRVGCAADSDADGGVTVDDLLLFLDRYANGDARADLDDGSSDGRIDAGVTIDDLLYYLYRFQGGC